MDPLSHIRIDLSFKDKVWYSDVNVKNVLFHLLLKYAENHQAGRLSDYEFRVSIKALSKELKLTERQIRSALKRLYVTRDINLKMQNPDLYRVIFRDPSEYFTWSENERV